MSGELDEGDVILAGVRARIDALDDALVDLLAQRFAAVAEAARRVWETIHDEALRLEGRVMEQG